MDGGVRASLSGTFVERGWQTVQEGMITLVGSDGTLRLDENGFIRLYDGGGVQDVPLLPFAEDDCGRTLTDILKAIETQSTPPTDISDNMKTFAMVIAAEAACDSGQVTMIKRST